MVCGELRWLTSLLQIFHCIEVWNGHSASLTKLTEEHTIENPGGLGVIGEQLWFMRRKTARQYLSFVSYLGMQGEENRIQLAEVFKRPTSWDDYCTLVSEDNCQTPDEFSTRPPSLEGEGGKYFVDGSYTGYFRATEQNNCTANPNCTGHIVDYPCGWSSFVSQQTYHLGIALESNGNEPSNGYSYSEMVQIWRAANATDSHVIMQWWKPESLYQEFLGTESEMQGIALPPPTQDCVENRIDPLDRCGDDPQLRIGDPLGSCTEGPYSLMKVISTALYDISFDPEKPEELHSPAYNTIKSFRVSELQLGKIFKYWFARDFDRFGLDPRDATCQWFVENTETLRSFIPRSHPRVIEDDDDVYKEPAFHVALALSCSAIFSTLCASVIVFILRDRPTIRYSQIEFLYLLLIGLLLVSIGSLLTALPPSDQICVAIVWLVNFGYTLELVPLIVKVAAINQFVAASEQMRRVKLTTASLFGAVIFFCLLVCVCLAVWTATDPPRKDEDLELTNGQSEDGVTVIQRSFYCNSEKEVWNFLGVSWQALLLLCASILAFQSRKVREDLNESKTLAMMIYSQTVLVVLRAITYALEGSLDHADVAAARSIIYSFDAIATLVIYFLPKFVHKEKNTRTTNGIPHEEQSPRLNVHKWKFRQPHVARDTAHTATGSGRRGDDDISVSDIHSHELSSQQLSSMQQNSFDFRTNAEWESSGGVVLEAVSEEAHSADSAEDDEPSGTGSVEHTSL